MDDAVRSAGFFLAAGELTDDDATQHRGNCESHLGERLQGQLRRDGIECLSRLPVDI